MWKKIAKNRVVRYIAGGLTFVAVLYFFITPLIIQHLFSQYDIVKKYAAVEVCTDLPPGTPSKVFLPVSCALLSQRKTLGCISDNKQYLIPAVSTDDQKKVCPLLVNGIDITGVRNPAVPALPMSEQTLKTTLTIAVIGVIVAGYIAYMLIRRRIRLHRSR
jgi:hypothetical protein